MKKVRIASSFEPKDLHLGENLSEVSRSSKDLMRITSLYRKSRLMVRSKYMMHPDRKAKSQFF